MEMEGLTDTNKDDVCNAIVAALGDARLNECVLGESGTERRALLITVITGDDEEPEEEATPEVRTLIMQVEVPDAQESADLLGSDEFMASVSFPEDVIFQTITVVETTTTQNPDETTTTTTTTLVETTQPTTTTAQGIIVDLSA